MLGWLITRTVPADVLLPKYATTAPVESSSNFHQRQYGPRGPIPPETFKAFVDGSLPHTTPSPMEAPEGWASHWFITYDRSEGAVAVNVLRMLCRQGETKPVDDFVESCHNRGMWLTAIHPDCGAELVEILKTAGCTFVKEKAVRSGSAAGYCVADGGVN